MVNFMIRGSHYEHCGYCRKLVADRKFCSSVCEEKNRVFDSDVSEEVIYRCCACHTKHSSKEKAVNCVNDHLVHDNYHLGDWKK